MRMRKAWAGGFNMNRVFWLGLLLSFAMSGAAAQKRVSVPVSGSAVGTTPPSAPSTACFSLIRNLDSDPSKSVSTASAHPGEATLSCNTQRSVLFEQSRTVLDRLGGGGAGGGAATGATQQVTITGRRWSDGWNTVCRGSECADLLDQLTRPSVEPLPNPIAEFFCCSLWRAGP
jgi:hypothetical protein